MTWLLVSVLLIYYAALISIVPLLIVLVRAETVPFYAFRCTKCTRVYRKRREQEHVSLCKGCGGKVTKLEGKYVGAFGLRRV